MGTFNSSCFISGLPIMEGDKVVLFFISAWNRDTQAVNIIYPGDLWSPLVLPISGVYGDYGTLKEIQEDENTRLITEFFKSKPAKYSDRYREYEYEDCSEIERLIKLIGQGDIEFEGDLNPISYCLAHADLAKAFVSSIAVEKGCEDFGVYSEEELKQHADLWFEWYKDHYELFDSYVFEKRVCHDSSGWNLEATEPVGSYWVKKAEIKYTIKGGYNGNNEFIRFFSTLGENSVQCTAFKETYSGYTKSIVRESGTTSDPRWVSIRDRMVQLIRFSYAMGCHDKTWLPLRLSGRAWPEIDKMIFFNKKITEKLKRIKKNIDQDM